MIAFCGTISQKYGFGIWDLGSGIWGPGSGKNLFRIPDPGVKKAPDPGSGSATLPPGTYTQITIFSFLLGGDLLSDLLGEWMMYR